MALLFLHFPMSLNIVCFAVAVVTQNAQIKLKTLENLLDPFAGGGSIPLEAQRLGLEAHASDLDRG